MRIFSMVVPDLPLYPRTKFQCCTFFPSQDIKPKCVTVFLFSQKMMSQTLRFIFNQLLKQWPTGKKKNGEQKYNNLNISRTKKAF